MSEVTGWWRLTEYAKGMPSGFSLRSPAARKLWLKPDGTYSSEGYVGEGSWSVDRDRVFLRPREWTLAQAAQHGPRTPEGPQPIVLIRSGDALRMYPDGRPDKGRWMEFVRYVPTAAERARGPLPRPSYEGPPITPASLAQIAFWSAVSRNDVAEVARRIKTGANLEGPRAAMKAYCYIGYTPLTLAVSTRACSVAEFLIRAGAKPNATMEGGLTPLMVAALNGDVSCVRTLLRRGADRRIKSAAGARAVDYARGPQKAKLIAILK